MLQLTPKSVIFIATVHVDFRKGINGLAATVKNRFDLEPFNGDFFMFYNKSKTSFKILSYDGAGFWLFTKRLSQGKFIYRPQNTQKEPYQQICCKILHILINNGDPSSIKFPKDWRSLRSD
jgi:transposase